MLVDLQVHIGEQGLPLDLAVERAAEIGLDGIAVVRENALPDLAPLRRGTRSVRLFAGALVPTDRGLYLLFFRKPEELPPFDQLFGARQGDVWPVRDVMARTHALGGAVIAVAPYDATIPHPGGDILYTLPNLAAVQSVSPTHPAATSEPAIEAAECLGLPCVGASGARTSLDEIGRGATLFAQPLQNEQDLVNALLSGSCWPVEFSPPPAGLLHRGRGAAQAPPRPEGSSAPASEGAPPSGERKRRRRRR